MEINWKGTYCHPEDEKGKTSTYSFEIIVKENDGSFIGYSVDDEFLSYSNEKVSVQGFIENGFISFIKAYPHTFKLLEDGSTDVDKTRKGHDVNYEGYFNEETGYWEGEWEIELDETETAPGQFEVLFQFGTWRMK